MDLIIVESPSKAKTIEKYLGGVYKVDASGGHVRDLPANRLGVGIKNNFEPDYVVNEDKKAVIKRLEDKAKKAQNVFLATDPDREGEAISWHLLNVLNLDINKQNRIVFNEISQKAVQDALEKPRKIDVNLVNSQQARRVLDRLVGYKLSPLVSKRLLSTNLSAGRVQSAALRMVVDREREIAAFIPEEFWNINAWLFKTSQKDLIFKALLTEYNGKKIKVLNKEQADKVLADLKNASYVVKSVKKSVSSSAPPPPFTTSTLQQDAANKLSLSSPLTMLVAQHLYEGVEIEGEGLTALVTYIRTDSVRISADAARAAANHIEKLFGKDYLPKTPNFFKSKKGAQDAHEAIRPIDLKRTPESLKDKLDKNHYRLYKLIYERFLASQMAEAKYNVVTVNIEANGYNFKATGRTLLFKGFTAVYEDFRNRDEENEESAKLLPDMTEKDVLNLNSLKGEQKFTKPPPRYTEASLIKTMEEKGIGRPSTYATVISVLSKRKYTEKDGKSLLPTEIAYKIVDFLLQYFNDIVDISFTAQMEEKLDEIEDGGKDWQNLIAEFFQPFSQKLTKANADNYEETDIVCSECGAMMVKKAGRYGEFLACSAFPECKHIMSLTETKSEGKCEKCGADMLIKQGKYGKFLGCSNYPQCKNIKRIAQVKGKCPVCGADTEVKTTKTGKTFYGCQKYPDCKFASWSEPTGEKCAKCGKYIILTSDGERKCVNKDCETNE